MQNYKAFRDLIMGALVYIKVEKKKQYCFNSLSASQTFVRTPLCHKSTQRELFSVCLQ